ncbi:Copper Transporter integral membrane protein that functions in high affinity copper transport [Cadophora gregata]|uniref:Copper Transporter integral membrane protein that functions in high affinity copper transport n=1 Tax=Cadophora gregata TaxID=51156 RepID=UPI0026DC271A|nr:Copper Transporter integral membrane protein that functions in high affinity copper transport [Cadophora gregata]KAK0118799.1 Copper Transporter integral membrane protein that functions in high affinity copper transport [Cadophora gregata f. sp. sojae]KAK0126059.1 Copper Transporter integral membrane protein that functions in high affinity copper transport [Cadophora gregata]
MSMAASTTMAMDMSSTATGAAASASTTAAMAMDMGGSCKISMLWNWNTVDSCFIARSWHITSEGMFAGCCVGVILLVMSFEFLRRLGKEYDRFILRQQTSIISTNSETGSSAVAGKVATVACAPQSSRSMPPFRPNIFQQMIRATLHMVSFTVAYFIMLLAMYYNGYIIICIIIGAWLGAFVFSWETVDLGGPKEEVTVCCG